MSLLAPLTAHSLGVGDIKLHSALNQKLNAEIALSLAADEDLSDIRVSLATPDKFDKLGISWSYFLSRVKFQPVVKANGKIVIKVTSDEVVQEPFLDFLVEVSWPKGDIYKEFTVLVDPPVIYQQSNVDVAALSPTKQGNTRYRNTAAAQNDLSKMSVDGEYGPTSRNDSLWKVAEKVNNGSDISVEQMMMALYKANPRAFYKKNVNALMEGKTLRIPKKADIVQLSKKQANTQFYRQMAVWEGKVDPEPVVQQTATNESNNNQLTLVPPTEEQLTSSDALTPDTTDQKNLATENQQLQERLANLEKQFFIMQEMMAIKDQQLAVMQNSQADANTVADSLAEEYKPVKIDSSEESLSEEVSDKKPDPVQETTTERVGKPPKATPLATVKPPVHKVTEQTSVKQDDGVNYYYIGLGLFGILAIGGLGWILWSRRQAEEEINENSMFASSSEIFLPDTDTDTDTDTEGDLDLPIFDERSSYDVGTVGESSFLSEFTPSDFDVFETDQTEVDPASETDVYLAYGRYQQAEELMRQAITDHPDNDDYKLKLFEIFYTSENAEAYEEYSSELIKEGKNSDVNFWSKVIEMGKELIPGSALFLPKQEAVYATDDELPEDSLNDINEDVNELAEQPVSDEGISDLDFDLSEFSLPDDKTDELLEVEENVLTEEIKAPESIDFDLSSFDMPDSSEINDSKEIDSLDISVDDAIETVEFNADEINVEDFDFSSEGLTFSDSQDVVSDNTQVDEESGNSDFDFDEVTDVPVAGLSSGSGGEDENNLLVSDLTDMDEFETKIDLAKAYIDMGDESAAKEIAQEVLDKGSDAQQTEAQVILDQLN